MHKILEFGVLVKNKGRFHSKQVNLRLITEASCKFL